MEKAREFTLSQVVTLTRELAKLRNKCLPVKLGYALGRNLAILSKEANIVEEQRQKLCERYARKDENGLPSIVNGVYDMSKEDEILCNNEFSEFLAGTVMLDGIMQIPVTLIEAVDNGNRYDTLTMAELETISEFIES